MRHTHSDRLERWLGKDAVEHVSQHMRNWYGPPIALMGVPGNVYAAKGGDFIGHCDAGQFGSAFDRFGDIVRREVRRYKFNHRRYRLNLAPRPGQRWHDRVDMNTFANLSAIIAAAAAGQVRNFIWQKVGTTGVVQATNSLWRVGNQPAAAGASSGAPGGNAPDDTTTGAFPFTNPSSGTLHVTTAWPASSVVANTLLMYDRIFQVQKTMSSTATEAVTGVPTRYQSGTGGAADSAEGNFLFAECQAALGATAHNWTVCLYEDQSGNTGATLPSFAGNSSNIINRLDHPTTASWFAPLASGDTGIQDLEQMQCSASVTGTLSFVIGHPLAWMPHPVANMSCVMDGINSAFNLARIFDDACLALLEITKPATTATTYTGMLRAVFG